MSGIRPSPTAGEEELNRQMQRFGERFDHNVHSLRIVESFEQRYARFPGLNLTFEVREGIVKHSRDLSRATPNSMSTCPGCARRSKLRLIDLADEIAYNTADLDDGFSAGLFTVRTSSPKFLIMGICGTRSRRSSPARRNSIRFNEALRMLIDWLVTGLIEGILAMPSAPAESRQSRTSEPSPNVWFAFPQDRLRLNVR